MMILCNINELELRFVHLEMFNLTFSSLSVQSSLS